MAVKGLILPQCDPASVTPPAADSVSVVVDTSGRINIVNSDGTISVVNPTNQTSAEVIGSSVAGNQDVGPGQGVHTATVNVSGGAGTRQFSLVKSSLIPADQGWTCTVVFKIPYPYVGIVLQVFDANTSGQLLFSYTTDGTQQSAVARFHYDGASWQLDWSKVPATS